MAGGDVLSRDRVAGQLLSTGGTEHRIAVVTDRSEALGPDAGLIAHLRFCQACSRLVRLLKLSRGGPLPGEEKRCVFEELDSVVDTRCSVCGSDEAFD